MRQQQLRSPCVNCNGTGVPECRETCVRLQCFKSLLIKITITRFCVLSAEEVTKIDTSKD